MKLNDCPTVEITRADALEAIREWLKAKDILLIDNPDLSLSTKIGVIWEWPIKNRLTQPTENK